MPRTVAAGRAALPPALDVLLECRAIMPGDHRAGTEYAFLASRRGRPHYRPLFRAATEVLDRAGARTMVEAVVLDGQLPRQPSALARLQDGLDALASHFREQGLL